MTDTLSEYDILFRKFYSDLFKFQTGKKNALHCKGCDTKKRFIINKDELIFSCGPKNNDNKKCGQQYTIKLPKYINFSDLYEIYSENINGSMKYDGINLLEYDLESLSQKMNVRKELDEQRELIKDSSEKLKTLLDDYFKANKMDDYIKSLEELSEKRTKNGYEKRKIMKLLDDNTLSEPEIIDLRKKYAVLVNENRGFMDEIITLRKQNTNYLNVKLPEITHHDIKSPKPAKSDSPKSNQTKTEDNIEILINSIFKLFKKNDGKLMKNDYRDMIKEEGFKTLWGNTLFKGLRKGERSWSKDLQNKLGSIIDPPESRNPDYVILTSLWRRYLKIDKKYSYEDQVKILTEYYRVVDPSKSDKDVKELVDRRRPRGSNIGTRIPTQPWLELCDKLNDKYNLHPLKMKEKDIKILKDNLFDPSVVFQFYSKSRDLEPGKGSGEKIPDDKIPEYEELSKIKNWRKMLSNFYESEFTLDDKRWLSVEHYYQGAKFKKENPDFYEQFSLDSDSDISKDPNLAKSAGGKSGKSKGKIIRPSNIKMDKDFFLDNRSSNEMKRAQREKYKQNEELKRMLLLTKDAKLTHFSRGSPPIVFNETMELRKEFKNK
tara:strand:+ start:4797 stop:6605 length:1809 start_codon:yes stop_codon:yes gene_type:complete